MVVAPSFIYGGDSFVLNPPRVPGGYGGFIEGLLSTGTRATPPAPQQQADHLYYVI